MNQIIINVDIVESELETNEVIYESSKSSGVLSSCHNRLLDSDIYETCIPEFDDYFNLLARVAREVKTYGINQNQ